MILTSESSLATAHLGLGTGFESSAGTIDLDTITVRGERPTFHSFAVDYSSIQIIDNFNVPISGFLPSKTAKEQETDNKQNDRCNTAGNPVVLYTGNKVEYESDFSSDGEYGLYLNRTYNKQWSGRGIFGGHWLSNFDYSLATQIINGKNLLWMQRPDGSRLKFIYNPTSLRWNEDKAQPVAWIVKNSDSTYTMHNEQNGIERYSTEGYVIELRNEQNISWLFTYSGKYLQKVTHSSGRSVNFTWTGNEVSQVVSPNNAIYTYTYTANIFGTGLGRLASTNQPSTPATKISYYYEDARFPDALTGKSINGQRYSYFSYDPNGRAISTEHAGGAERYTFSYFVESEEAGYPPACAATARRVS